MAQGGIVVKGECKTLANTVEKTVENVGNIATAPSRGGALKVADKEIEAIGSTINQTNESIVEPTLGIVDGANNTISKALPTIKDTATAIMTGGTSLGVEGFMQSMQPAIPADSPLNQKLPITGNIDLDMQHNLNHVKSLKITNPMTGN